ncbi:uncharacterized protein LOC129267555 [Lytechinus pictus]|uniref:uncharacterized protein LOC129267555 n=1 Tax=Lytechinus pictus TaxID=7653 RepID=UPI0030B9B699
MAEAIKTVTSQSTECPVCLSTFTDPKILSCSHAFCKTCLDNLLECHGNSQIRCPVCRAVTQVPNQDVSKLHVNLSLKCLLEDMKGHHQICTNCKSDNKPHAVVYCRDCGKYLCTSCLNKHSQWEGFIDHEVIAMSEIPSSGKVFVRRYRKCRKHPKEDEGKGAFNRNIRNNELGLGKVANVVGKDELGLSKIILAMIIMIVSFCIAQIALQHNIVVGLGSIFNVDLAEKYVVLPTYNIADVKHVALPAKNSMNAMVSTPDGRMAVGYYTGGISIFSSDGKLQQTVLKDVNVRGLGFLSNGRCVVIDFSNSIILYTPEYTKMNVMFKTLSKDEDGILTVDGDDQIYVTYWKVMKIQVFSTAGGQAIREIPCNGYSPHQITSYDGSLITSSIDTIRLINKQGAVQHELKKPGSLLYAAVSQGNTILMAKVKHGEGLVSIDEYTNELRHIRNLVNDFKIEKPERVWYYLQQYRSGEIAFCTPDRLYIFKQK